MSENCPFCDDADAIIKGRLVYSRFDKYPVSPGHTLITPIRHVESYFKTTHEEKIEILEMIERVKEIIDQEYEPDGFNIGINIGDSAGQSIPHVHMHVIPRYAGDMGDPKGGVRGVIPNKQKY